MIAYLAILQGSGDKTPERPWKGIGKIANASLSGRQTI